MTAEAKLNKLYEILDSMGTVAVAYSGGVDSTFLLKTAYNRLGAGVIAITAVSALFPEEEIEAARQFTIAENITHDLVFLDIFENTTLLANPPDRCYHCKLAVFSKIREYAQAHHIDSIADGSNLEDQNDYRPGNRALFKLGIRSPLFEAGLTKSEIRLLSKEADLSVWDKPANPCLATRIPYGTAITKETLEKIRRAESYLHAMGLNAVRVRCHENLARIEVPPEQRHLLIEKSAAEKISADFKNLGFIYVTIDIEGYRMGSMNDSIEKETTNGSR